ncbi:MAG TPA: hypothetical protein H9666_10855 [Firmicutes bacterium]|mgnify:FL=1|nr:hypothetical protein [Bacillota bacterium]
MLRSYPQLDPLSYQLGMVGAFCEMVQQGVKSLALSPPIPTSQAGTALAAAQEIAGHYGVRCWADGDFLPSDLAHAEDLAGHTVILLYRDDAVLSAYQALKDRRSALAARGMAPRQADAAITPELRQLLGYPA